jgi:hypothetical protein
MEARRTNAALVELDSSFKMANVSRIVLQVSSVQITLSVRDAPFTV